MITSSLRLISLTSSSMYFMLTMTNAYSADAQAHQPVSYSSNLLQMMLGLAAIIVMIFAVVWLIKKVGYVGHQKIETMKIKSCLPLSTKEKLLLVEVGEEQILIGVAPGFVGHIKTLEQPLTPIASDFSADKKDFMPSLFSEKLKNVINKGEVIE